MEEYTIQLNAQHLQVIRAQLGKAPYDLAEPLIRTIGAQVAEQQKPQDVPAPAPEPQA
ncbi:MAG: hypothetical protein KGL63_09485 [Betaproteobacteria bacterium]|nr:hypothetical protein [Betaproteobacteria bacterium]